MKEKLFSLLLVLFIALPLSAQTSGAGSFTIKGQVVDSLTNEGVSYATLRIVLMSAPQQAPKMLACDIDGKFETTLAAAGQYTLFMQSIGKVSSPKQFTLTDGQRTLNLGNLLMDDDQKMLSEVTVSAQKPLIKMEIDKISYNLEEDPEAKTNNMLDMLRKVPMITVDGEDNIKLKGSGNYKLYMNGKPSNLLSKNPSDVLKSMPASAVKNIEVITDPGAKYDAEGVGGIINIITTSNALQGYTGSVRANASTMGFYGGNVYLSSKIGKLGLTAMYNYNYRDMPWNTSELERENFVSTSQKYLKESGQNKYTGPFQYGYLEASYEIDTLNLINVGANIYNGRSKSKSNTTSNMYDIDMNPVYKYNRYSNVSSEYGSTDINVDYQHSTRKKDELLTISYRFSHQPDGSDSYVDITDTVNYRSLIPYPQQNNNDAWTAEHTGQVDYTTPLFKGHTLEVGAKYIYRQSNSETDRQYFVDSLNTWKDIYRDDSHFKHTQHIYSGYLGYALRVKKFSIKAGVRAEGTALSVDYKLAPEHNFSTDYFDIVPNATFSYQLSMASQLRLGYNMRIRRPSIWYLNPYVNNTDPQNISYGNPNLDSEKSNSVNMNYSMFTQKFNINASLSYTFVNNSIERYAFIDSELPNVTQATYDNIGRSQRTGGFVYGRWNPIPLFSIMMNGGLNYTDLKSAALNISNSGWEGNAYLNLQFNLPKDFRIYLNGGYYSPWIQLQGKGSDMYFTGLSASKDFLKKKLTVQLSFNEPFRKNQKYESTMLTDDFYSRSVNYNTARSLSISVSYRFGTLKEQIKKVQRGISNDDSKAGGSGSSSGGSGGGGQ